MMRKVKTTVVVSKLMTELNNSKIFEILSDGWIKDGLTRLEWGTSSAVRMNYKDAIAYCVKKGGRLPTRIELETIQDLTKYNPCIDKKIFKDTQSNWYWSGTKCAWHSDAVWCVSFDYGDVVINSEYDDSYVRPVRCQPVTLEVLNLNRN